MKIIKRIILLLFFSIQFSNACMCSGVISSSYSDFKTHIISKLNSQSNALKELQKSIEKNTQTIEKQINIFIKDNSILENDLLEINRKIFELRKQNQLR
ncbi:hypothetical protein B0619_07245 [Campylobacter lari]|uniref:Uncharacterized protein n=1 Tax=Campylobacter peloridis TaxID=488546 RepID=A0A5C7DYG8_9BACT|nr:hypothetical protein [Campylobacter peloridis]EAI7269760.1 hypothetical protein [Campylobacter lari]EAK5787001.1 hypothetical protein [Campylobacter lari]TXE84762.1 hypothetical protein FPD46_00570 [Campylobacter peloridis]